MRLTIPPSPAHLAGLRRAAQASLREVSSEVAEEVVLAIDEAATMRSCTDREQVGRWRWPSRSRPTGWRPRSSITARPRRHRPG
jgi:hypothetical protein